MPGGAAIGARFKLKGKEKKKRREEKRIIDLRNVWLKVLTQPLIIFFEMGQTFTAL